MKKLTTSMSSLSLVLLVASCGVESLVDYTPVVDTYNTNMTTFNKDLEQCRNIALRVEADYEKRQQEQALSNALAGALAGALTGAIIGSGSDYQGELAGYGAVAGAASGAAANDYTRDLVKFGPRRVVDRCMADRGHKVLNDVGRG